MGKVKIGLLPSIKNGLAIGLIGAKIRRSGLAISPWFTKQHLGDNDVGIAEWGLFNTQIIKWDNATAIGGVSIIKSKQEAKWNRNKLIQLWAVGVAEQDWDNAKQVWALGVAFQGWDNVKQVWALGGAIQEWDHTGQVWALGGAIQKWNHTEQIWAVFYTKP